MRADKLMRSTISQSRCIVLVAMVVFFLLLTACGNAPSALDPRGPAAAQIATLWWVMFVLATAVYVLVVALLFLGIVRGKRGSPSDEPRKAASKRWIIGGGILMPVVILVGLNSFTLYTEVALSRIAANPTVSIQVIGHNWWWEVAYPGRNVVTANEIHIPVGQPVEVRLTSTDVIHSFWVPQLHGKLDLIPGRTNTIVIEATEPGVYRGQCAEYCGIQHTKMAFRVIAQPADVYEAWIAQQARPAREPVADGAQRGQRVFLSRGCVNCHAIQGTSATGALGPNLTHLASRQTLAAGTLANNPGNLGGWILNPQTIKPGSHMPPTQLSGEELQALLSYLETLE